MYHNNIQWVPLNIIPTVQVLFMTLCGLFYYPGKPNNTSVKIIKNEVGCRDDTVPKTVDTRRHCEEE